MEVKASYTRHDGERQLKVGQFRAVIITRWFGRKTCKSRKPTWNETLMCSGPKEWVVKEWEKEFPAV